MSPILVWEGPGEVPNFCPQGCGGITEDRYGGPCRACWDAVGAGPDINDHDPDDPDCPCDECEVDRDDGDA